MRSDRRGLPMKLAAVGAAGAAFSACSAAISLSGPGSADRVSIAVGSILATAVPIGVGICALYREPENRFGALLVATGFLWGLTTLSASGSDILYSVGRVSLWFAEAAMLYTMLAYPTGRLTRRAERVVVCLLLLLVASLYLPTALISEQYVLPFPLTTCTSGCPTNAFMLTGSEPSYLGAVENLRDVLAVLLFTAALVILTLRITRATSLMRLILSPVLAIAIARIAAVAVYQLAASHDPGSEFTQIVGWLAVFGIPAMAVSFLVGLIIWRIAEARMLELVTAGLRTNLGPEGLESLISNSMFAESVRVVYHLPSAAGLAEESTDAVGRSAQLPEPGSSQVFAEYPSGEHEVAIVHDEMLTGQTRFLEAIASCATAALENRRLSTALRSSLKEVAESRARIVAAGDEERRRIERDLHDGAQQQLVTLRIKLELIAEMIEGDPDRAAGQLQHAGVQVAEILDEVRSLSRGIYPALLVDAGLGEALGAVARRASVPTSVDCDGIGRYSPELESAVYFCCLEALQNAGKHARGAKYISMRLHEADEKLRFEVRDDGAGFAPAAVNGGGLANMRDRVAVLGGRLSVTSSPGTGTRVVGNVPL